MGDLSCDKIVESYLEDEEASELFASHLANIIRTGMLLTFHGEIGAGKTTIIRAMLKALGVTSAVKSPTFSLVESYKIGDDEIHHFDLYRIQHEEELDYLGFRDYFSDHTICIIEWAEHAAGVLPKVDLRFNLSISGPGRNLQIRAESDMGIQILTGLAGEI